MLDTPGLMTTESETEAVYRRLRELFPMRVNQEVANIGDALVRALEDKAREDRRPWCLVCHIFHAPGAHDPRCGICGHSHEDHEVELRCCYGAHSWTCDCASYAPMTTETARAAHMVDAAKAAGDEFDAAMRERTDQ